MDSAFITFMLHMIEQFDIEIKKDFLYSNHLCIKLNSLCSN